MRREKWKIELNDLIESKENFLILFVMLRCVFVPKAMKMIEWQFNWKVKIYSAKPSKLYWCMHAWCLKLYWFVLETDSGTKIASLQDCTILWKIVTLNCILIFFTMNKNFMVEIKKTRKILCNYFTKKGGKSNRTFSKNVHHFKTMRTIKWLKKIPSQIETIHLMKKNISFLLIISYG